jgi:putative FmdB family regulatory protein
MPTYPYECSGCHKSFNVTKSLLAIDEIEVCNGCGHTADRRIGLVNFNNAGDWKPSFNPAFGCVVKSKAHQREILSRFKDKGKEFIEVGNEPIENVHKIYDSQRENARKERWNEPVEKILSEALK